MRKEKKKMHEADRQYRHTSFLLVNLLGQGPVITGLYLKCLCEHSRVLGLGYNLQAFVLLEK